MSNKTIVVEQTKSPIGRRATLKDTPDVRGMVATVAHLVRVVDSK